MTAPTTHWGKLYGSLCLHPKWLSTPAEGRALWTSALSYCIVIGSDGDVPEGVLHMLNAPGADVATSVQQLLDSGLWVRSDKGYRFHDWSDFQQTVDERKDVRRKRSEAGKASAEARRKAKSDAPANTSATSVQAPVEHEPNISPTEKRREEKRREEPKTAGYTAEFESFWKLYPIKASKSAAFRAYKTAIKKYPDLEVKLRDYLTARAKIERTGEFIPAVPFAATWLNGNRWEDYAPVVTTTDKDGQEIPEWSRAECDDILGGSDYWVPTSPPEGLDLFEEKAWKREQMANHLNERRRKAWEVTQRERSAA